MDKKTVEALLETIKAKATSDRFEQGFNKLLKLSEEQPNLLYPHWEYIATFLRSENQYRKYIAIFLLANLTKVDSQNKLESIFDDYFDILYGKRLIAAATLAKIAWKIVHHKPSLEPQITEKLLAVDKSQAKHKDTIKIGVMESFTQYFAKAQNQPKILQFVREFSTWDSPKAQKLAKAFLKQWDK